MNDISNIVNGIDVKDDFSFVDTLGKLICNRDFSLSYDKFKGGQKSSETFIWESLQNIGNEFGKKIHQNIRDYIDLVSNVDRCKIKSLQSMFKMYGQQYKIIDNILKYPLEIQNLIDLFSISKKYLLKNDFLNEDFKQQLIDDDIITKTTQKGDYNYYNIQLDSNKFNIYVKNIFKQLIIDFLELSYNDSKHTKIIDTLNPLDEYSSLDRTEEEIEKFKRENNVPVSFNQVKIVNDIDNGVDFLENYFGIELKILNMEIDRRAKTLSIIDIGDNDLINTDNYSVEQKTRYSYYRKAKFLEYRDFVNNMFTKENNLSSINRYGFNNSFIEFDEINSESVLVWNSTEKKYEINESIVENVSNQLMEMTEYLVSLRERLKIQTRKNYMRGTSNLLIYVINQYLVDYSKTHRTLFNSLSNYNQLSSLQKKLLNHSSENINVIEYTDQTEYFNIKTDSTKYALNENDANERYWEGQNAQTAGYISDSEIQNFYLDRLQLSSESEITNAFEFLDTIFNLGASDSYIDKETGIFSTQLDEKNETWSLDYVKQLSSIDYNWGKISGYLNFGKDNAYEFPETTISNQISAAINDYIYQQISVQNLSGVSEVYDIFKPQLDDISSKIDQLTEIENQILENESMLSDAVSSNLDQLTEIKNQLLEIEYKLSTEIKNQLLEIEYNIQNYIPDVIFSNDSFEEKIEFDLKLITNDKENKIEQANINIQNQMDDVEITFENIENIISSFLSTDTNLCSIIQQQKDFLNLSDNDVYMTSLNMYNMYNGLCADSEVYFNYKNITHPSRQFHPYLRNMINSESLKDIFDNVLKQYQIDELDEESIQNSIDKYIGTFGQMINIWKTPINDYTGYSSRYEQSDKIVDRTGLKQEIVDYDGLFYPAAVNLLKENKTSCIYSIQQVIDDSNPESGSFYDRFYAPLGLTKAELQNEKIRLETYADDIIRIATEQNNELSVYDIYKYGIDGYGNSYSLLKLYPNLRYKTKKNQSGRLWMRLKSYPFSYPAFSNYGNLSVDPQYTAFKNVIEDEITSNISSNYGKIYDFEFSNDKSILAIITENSSNDEHTFDTANVFVSKISLYDDNFVIEDADIFKHEKVENVLESKSASNFKKLSTLTLADCFGETLNNVVSSEMSVLLNSDKISSLLSIDNIGNKTLYDIYNSELSNISELISANLTSQYNEGPTDGLFYSLIGCTPYNSNNFHVSYILKHFKYDQTNDIVEKSIPEYTKFSIVDYNQQKSAVGDSINLPRKAIGTDVVVANINDKNISFGLLIESQLSNDETVLTAYTSQDGNLSANNANGPTIESDDTEMNSHDVFTSDILVRTFNLREQSIEMLYEQIFNINSDISYIPVYPGEGNVAQLNDKYISSDNYFTIELLGSSKNIDNDIQQVNPNPNPYVTMEDIQTNQQFGRVYEDYIPENDTSLQILNNPRIDTNPIAGSNVEYIEEEKYFQWKITLSDVFKPSDVKYDEDDYNKLKILIYNIDTYGKNPYIMDDLTALQSEKYVSYNSDISSYEEYVNQLVDIVGTYNNKGMNSLENNSLDSISAISLKFDDTSKDLTIKFYVNESVYSGDSEYNINNVFVDANKIKVCLINDKNLKMFEYYHYMDAFGIKISADYFPSDKRFSNYYISDSGEKTYLSSINFAKYDSLSDIEILSGIDGAIFKYGEEIQFDLSNNMVYMPTINTWYPKTAGQYMAEKSITMKPSNDQTLTSIFLDNQIYYIDIPDQKQIIDALEQVYVSSYIDNSDTLMMDEDVYISALNTIHAIEDPRIFESGIVANISSDYTSSDNITAEYENISIEQLIDNLVNDGLSPMATEQGRQASIYSIQIDNKNNIDIERFLRLHVNYKKDIEHDKGIVLYFNYLNYINTPYIRLDEGKIYPSIIDGTFLKLNPGEDGILNIVLQFRYYEHGKVRGVSNKTVLSYHIYNISDDKPKFLIREIFRIKPGYTGQKEELPFKMSGGDISCKNNSTFNYSIGWETISQIEQLSFDLVFDGYMMKCLSGDGIIENGPSTITVNVQNFTQNFIDIPFEIINANDGDQTTIYLDNINVVPIDNNFILLPENEHDGKVTIIR